MCINRAVAKTDILDYISVDFKLDGGCRDRHIAAADIEIDEFVSFRYLVYLIHDDHFDVFIINVFLHIGEGLEPLERKVQFLVIESIAELLRYGPGMRAGRNVCRERASFSICRPIQAS